MILDERTEFCDALALNTGAAGTYLLGDQVDLGKANNVGTGDYDEFVITVDTTATSGGAATAEFQLVSDAQAAIAVDGSATVHWTSGPIPVAQLVAGATLARVKLPKGFKSERYLGVLQKTGTAAFTAGKINAFITPASAGWDAFESNTGY